MTITNVQVESGGDLIVLSCDSTKDSDITSIEYQEEKVVIIYKDGYCYIPTERVVRYEKRGVTDSDA
jgi:hypothetical protein